MPGIVVFKRRWSVGSDDLVVPAIFLVILHSVWIIVLGVILGIFKVDSDCSTTLREHVLGYIVIMSGCLLIEGCIAWVSMRGTILDPTPRKCMQYLLYIRLAVFIIEVVWLVIGVVWVAQNFQSCKAQAPKRAILGVIVCNWVILFSVLISLWCTFDAAGRSWVKMKRYQESLKEKERENRPGHKRRSGTGSGRRNWRHRKAMRKYEQSWDRRCKVLFCCVKEDRHRNSFTEVARLFTEFFRDLDVVPTDVVAGLMLLRKQQKQRRKFIVSQGSNEVYQFLSGVPISPSSKFLSLKNSDDLFEYKKVIHYMRYALAAYGWPIYMMMNTGAGLCKIMPHLSCCFCCCCCRSKATLPELVEDNCCQCNFAALKKLSGLKNTEVVYCTYHVDIGETPFYIAIDHEQKTVVISIRGTLSLQDVLTDLKAEPETIPVEPIKEDWLGHKGMVQAAVYIKRKIKEEMLLSKAFGHDLDKGTQEYELVLIGHSLGAGTAAILAILLHQEYPRLHCYAFSPPGGLISATCVEDTKSFITSVVVGKDVVPRIGLYQLETLRQDLINVIKKSDDSKWKIIGGTMMCCCCNKDTSPDLEEETDPAMAEIYETNRREKESRYFTHPTDSQIALTQHIPLYPPGKIMHVVRNHPKAKGLCKSQEPVYQAIWAGNMDFDEVLISPTMINDHMPDKVMDALEKVLTNVSPAKPIRKYTDDERKTMIAPSQLDTEPSHSYDPIVPQQHGFLETSFMDNNDTISEYSGIAYGIAPDNINNNDGGNNSGWDYGPSPVTEYMGGGEKRCLLRPKSYPPKPRPTFKLELMMKEDWSAQRGAPLATPETLSDASSLNSITSKSSKKLSNQIGYQRLSSDGSTLCTIQQSPLRATRSEILSKTVNEIQHNPIDVTNVCPRDTEMLINSFDNQIGHDNIIEENSQERVSSGCTLSPVTDESELSSKNKSIGSPNNEICCNCRNIDVTKTLTLNLEDEITNKVHNPPYLRHSPEASNQMLYDLHNNHYTHAGMGYPHGGYMNGLTNGFVNSASTNSLQSIKSEEAVNFVVKESVPSIKEKMLEHTVCPKDFNDSKQCVNNDSEPINSCEEKVLNGVEQSESSPECDTDRRDFQLHIDEDLLLRKCHDSEYYNKNFGNFILPQCDSDGNTEIPDNKMNGNGFSNNNNILDSPCQDNVSLSDSEPFMIQHVDSDSQSTSPNNLYTLIHSGLFIQESEV